jgi:hypothetical protein
MNELATTVPGRAARAVKGIEPMLTQEDIAQVIDKPVRWVREHLLATGILEAACFGGNSYRVTQATFRKWLDKGCPGFRAKV